MLVKILEPFSAIDIDLSPRTGKVIEIADEERANKWIAAGLVERVEQIIPEGSITITKNGITNVSTYAQVKTQVSQMIIKFKNTNPGLEAEEFFNLAVSNGDSIEQELVFNFPFTIPEGKVLAGFSTEEDSEVADINFPFTPSKNQTLYTVFEDEE